MPSIISVFDLILPSSVVERGHRSESLPLTDKIRTDSVHSESLRRSADLIDAVRLGARAPGVFSELVQENTMSRKTES